MNGQQSQKVSMNGQQNQKVSINGLPYNNNKNYYKYKSHNSSHKNICWTFLHGGMNILYILFSVQLV
jgi:hypothetical protein